MKSRTRSVQGTDVSYTALMFWCPGCEEMEGGGSGLHMLPVNSPQKNPQWRWNNNTEAPTLHPSVLTYGRERCHSFIRDGKIQFLPDSTHSLAGQIVELPDLPDWVAELR